MAPPLSTVIERARQGDARAIAHLLTRSLVDQGIVARGQWQGTQLHLDLEAEDTIDQRRILLHIRRGLQRLDLTCPVEAVWVSSRRVGQQAVDWQESFGIPTVFTPAESPLAPLSPPSPEPSPKPETGSRAELSPEGNALEPPPPFLSDTALATMVHLTPLFSYLIVGSQWIGGWPLFWGGSFLLPWRVVAPLVLLLVTGTGAETAGLQHQTKAALNFQLTMLIAWLVTIMLMIILVGFVLVVPLALLEIISCIVAAVRVSEGKPAHYIAAIRFVR